MTQDEIIEMANKAYAIDDGKPLHLSALFHLEIFAKLVAAKEREACAKVCELAECEQENRLLKERIKHMERDFALERQQLLNENTEIYGLLGMAHLNLKQHLEYGFNPKTATSTLISVGRYAPKLREAMKNHGTTT